MLFISFSQYGWKVQSASVCTIKFDFVVFTPVSIAAFFPKPFDFITESLGIDFLYLISFEYVSSVEWSSIIIISKFEYFIFFNDIIKLLMFFASFRAAIIIQIFISLQ